VNYETNAFNQDTFLLQAVKDLIAKYGIQTIVETGTYKGDTTLALAGLVPHVITSEIHPIYYDEAMARLKDFPNVRAFKGNSPEILAQVLPTIIQPSLFFLDAHWYAYCPLLDEIKAVANAQIKPVIIIHDFFVPDSPDLGFDTFKGQKFDFEWVKPMLDLVGSYKHWYNTSATAAGSRRGALFADFIGSGA